jgi:hypothetical protein
VTVDGRYEVVFEADVQNGVFVATIGDPANQRENPGFITVAQRNGNTKAIFVETNDASGNHADRGFHLIVMPGAAAPTASNGVTTVNVVVFSHSEVGLTDQEADQILSEMGTVLQTKDSSNDVAVPVGFRRKGSVQPMPPGIPAAIQTTDQQNQAFAVPGIKVVRDLEICGDLPGGPDVTIIGCSPQQSPVVNEIVEFNPDVRQQGVLWVHEYGHNAGLSHRSDDPNAVMLKFVTAEHRVVNAAEALAYQSGPAAALGGVMIAAAPHGDNELQPALQDDPSRPKDVRVFVRRHYAEGVPMDVASTYTAQDADVLLGMLANPGADAEFLPEIVTTLCYIGNEKAIDPLIAFVNAPPASLWAFRAQKAALLQLGTLVNQVRARNAAPAETERALNLLSTVASAPDRARALATPRLQAARAEAAGAAQAGRRAVTPPTQDQLAAELAISATLGMAYSGHPRVQAALGELGAASSAAFEPVKRMVPNAAKVYEEVRSSKSIKEYRMRSQHSRSR